MSNTPTTPVVTGKDTPRGMVSGGEQPNLTPPIVKDHDPTHDAAARLNDLHAPEPDKSPDDLDQVLAKLKADRAALARAITEKIGKRATLMSEITSDRAAAKRLDRFIAAETPRGSKSK